MENLVALIGLNADALTQALQAALDACGALPSGRLSFSFGSSRLLSLKTALGTFSERGPTVFGFLSKQEIPFALLLEEKTASDLVYLLLGSTGEAPSQKHELSAVEEGLLSFVLALLFETLQKHIIDGLGTSIHFGPLTKSLTLEEAFAKESQLLKLSIDCKIDQLQAPVHVLVAAAPLQALITTPDRPEDRDEILKRAFHRASETKTPASCVIGQLSLAPEDIKALEVDDIVVLESSRVKMNGNVLTGEADCLLGDPQFAKATAQLSLAPNGRYVMQISDLQSAPSAEQT